MKNYFGKLLFAFALVLASLTGCEDRSSSVTPEITSEKGYASSTTCDVWIVNGLGDYYETAGSITYNWTPTLELKKYVNGSPDGTTLFHMTRGRAEALNYTGNSNITYALGFDFYDKDNYSPAYKKNEADKISYEVWRRAYNTGASWQFYGTSSWVNSFLLDNSHDYMITIRHAGIWPTISVEGDSPVSNSPNTRPVLSTDNDILAMINVYSYDIFGSITYDPHTVCVANGKTGETNGLPMKIMAGSTQEYNSSEGYTAYVYRRGTPINVNAPNKWTTTCQAWSLINTIYNYDTDDDPINVKLGYDYKVVLETTDEW